MKLPRPALRRERGEPMLPLINLVFLLMAFFMLVGAVGAPTAFAIRPAQTGPLDAADAGSQLLILSADGRYGWGHETFGSDALAERARVWRQAHPDAVLQFAPDAAAPAPQVVATLERLRSGGVGEVRLLAQRRRAP